MGTASGAEKYFEGRKSSGGYAKTLSEASLRIKMFDDVIDKIDNERRSQNLSKAELARRAGLPAGAVRRIFSQQHKNPTLSTLVAIIAALGGAIAIISSSDRERVTK